MENGKDEAIVGVVKPTRFYPQPARRLFIFKQINGKIRPMWMGSRMGGILCDFRFLEPYVRTLQATTDNKYVVADYVWDDFGLSFVRFLTEAVNHEEALNDLLRTNKLKYNNLNPNKMKHNPYYKRMQKNASRTVAYCITNLVFSPTAVVTK